MFPASFDYHRAATLDDAIRLLGEHEGAKLLAGGHSLIPMMKLRLAQPPVLIDIGRIEGLSDIEDRGGTLHLGALTSHREIASSETVASLCPVLAEAAGKIADPAVRNKGTIGGNIAHADPASDLPAVLVATEATVHLLGPSGPRTVGAEDFFVGLLATDLREDEVITAIEVAGPGQGTGSAYAKVEHPASGYALCGAAAVVSMEGGKCTAARLAFNGISPVPCNASPLVAALEGSGAEDDAVASALEGLAVDDPLGDLHASVEYRLQLAKVYGRRALIAARDRAMG